MVRSHLECGLLVPFGHHYRKGDTEALEKVQKRTTKPLPAKMFHIKTA